jgi:hypothetical protein
MNLYKYHSRPETLDLHDQAFEQVPRLAWEKYWSDATELRKREKIWARNPKIAYLYASVVKEPFPAGEAIIAQDPWYAYWYASFVLHKPWPAGEVGIIKDALCAYHYARSVLKLPETEADKWAEEQKC